MTKPRATYETVVLGVLAYEFPFSKPDEAETLIRNRLKRKKLGAFDPARLNVLRRLKDDLQFEMGKG